MKKKNEKGKMQTVGFEPTRANTLRPERSTLDHSVIFACIYSCQLTHIKDVRIEQKGGKRNKHTRKKYSV